MTISTSTVASCPLRNKQAFLSLHTLITLFDSYLSARLHVLSIPLRHTTNTFGVCCLQLLKYLLAEMMKVLFVDNLFTRSLSCRCFD